MRPLRGRAAALGLSYRALTEADLPFVEAMYVSSRLEELAPTGWNDSAKHAFLVSQHRLQHQHYQTHYRDTEWLIVERDGAAIGRLYLADWPAEIRVVDVAIAEGSCGQGCGTAILKDVLATARAAGKPVTIHVEKGNAAARLYERLGFRLVEDKGVYDFCRWDP